jgi:sec-independent protein translocase protein TatA
MPGFGSVGIWEVILILAILLLVFGAKRLPEIGAALGKGIREFKGSVREIENEINRPGDRPRNDLPRSEAPRAEPSPRTDEPVRREVESTRTEPPAHSEHPDQS